MYLTQQTFDILLVILHFRFHIHANPKRIYYTYKGNRGNFPPADQTERLVKFTEIVYLLQKYVSSIDS